ncbi:hypothetical protein D3C75_986320 [compost metagenome]
MQVLIEGRHAGFQAARHTVFQGVHVLLGEQQSIRQGRRTIVDQLLQLFLFGLLVLILYVGSQRLNGHLEQQLLEHVSFGSRDQALPVSEVGQVFVAAVGNFQCAHDLNAVYHVAASSQGFTV